MKPLEEHARICQHLKQVSRIKHIVLKKYLPSWERILGSQNSRLCYFDCYSGPGVYECEGELVNGSPVIAVDTANDYLSSPQGKGKEITLILVEQDDKQRTSLEKELQHLQPYAKGLNVYVLAEDAREFVPSLLESETNLAPSFFMVDPYGHPLTVPILNKILERPRTEALITFMYFRINMDAENPMVQQNVDKMFGNKDWRQQLFLQKSGRVRETEFLEYFTSQIKAKYKLPFRIRFDPEDKMSRDRTKYYLIHVSNHPKAVLLMKEVMWPLGDEEGLFDYSGRKEGVLISSSPRKEELKELLIRKYAGRKIEFNQLREEIWNLPYIEKDYRAVIKQLRAGPLATTIPVTSKTDKGLRGRDIIRFSAKK